MEELKRFLTLRELVQMYPNSVGRVLVEKDGDYSMRYWKTCLDERVAMWAILDERLTEVHLL